jgi:hypothetical protein
MSQHPLPLRGGTRRALGCNRPRARPSGRGRTGGRVSGGWGRRARRRTRHVSVHVRFGGVGRARRRTRHVSGRMRGGGPPGAQAYQACERARNFRRALAALLGLPPDAAGGACLAAVRRLLGGGGGGGSGPGPSPTASPNASPTASPASRPVQRASAAEDCASPAPWAGLCEEGPRGSAAEDDKENVAAAGAGARARTKADPLRVRRRVKCGGWPEVEVLVPGDRDVG